MEDTHRKIVLSAIQPTGDMHLGNYFGAVKTWVDIQDIYTCFFGVVNYHSMTMPYKPAQLQENTWKMAFMILACGVKPDRLFLQSLVPEHTELAWILGCLCSYGELGRMTQFKDKTNQLKEQESESMVTAGLFFYPVLQAADILMYRAHYVPVGKDQEQHLELTRNIAARFNRMAGKEYFPLPEPLYTETPKLLSLADPTRKMGKSYGEKHYVSILADDEKILRQVRSAVTDSGDTPEGQMSVGIANLFEILKACGHHETRSSLMEDYEKGQLKYVALKEAVAVAVVELVTPIRERYQAIQADKKQYKAMIQESSAAIRQQVAENLREIKELAGLPNLKRTSL
jgi:tryptophanyl-tRNA synthetase